MKIATWFACLILAVPAIRAQRSLLTSDVYTAKINGPSVSEMPQKLFAGAGNVLERMEMYLHTIRPGGKPAIPRNPSVFERFLIIREGGCRLQLRDSLYRLTAGSVITLMPGDSISIDCDSGTVLYEMAYRNDEANAQRAAAAGGSFAIDWNSIPFKPHDKGGVRQFFNRPTAMLGRFDMHVTTLNAGNKSHDPHRHRNEEIIVMLQGNAEMQIGDMKRKANAGDVVYLGSNVLHNLENIGALPCIYYAIQWN